MFPVPRKKPLLVLLLACSLVLWMPVASAQNQDKGDQVETLKSYVNVVNLFFNVKDKRGALIPNLTKNDFEVYEDGKPQTIKYFSAESNQPLTLGLLIDSSASQERVLEEEKIAGAQFLREVLHKDDLAFLISFDVNVDLLQDFTNDSASLRRAMDRTRINSGGGGGSLPGLGGGPVPVQNPRGTLLYDAVYLASNEKLSHEVGRKAMILLTDGEDQGSRTRINEAVEAAQKSDSIVYVIMIADRWFYGGLGYSGDKQMKKLCEETGGRVINAGNKPEKLKEAFAQIAEELRSQYSIGYTPTNMKRDGSFRRVEIKLKNKDMRVQARQGYYAPDAKRDNGY